jgi:hypothetical protein
MASKRQRRHGRFATRTRRVGDAERDAALRLRDVVIVTILARQQRGAALEL